MVLKRKSPSCGAPRFRRRPSQGGRSAPDTRWHAACALPVAASAFPSFSNNTNRGALRKEGAPIHTFLCRLDKYGSVNDHARRRRRESRRRHRRGNRRNRHRRRGSFLRRQSCRLQIRRRCAEAGAGAGRDAAPAGAAGPYGGDDGRPSYWPRQKRPRAERRAAVISAVTAAAPAARPAERADERQHDHEEHDHPQKMLKPPSSR